MARKRHLLMTTGDPAQAASAAALRLAHLGDRVEPVSATEFVWAPADAERFLFRGPRAVTVRFQPGTDPGTCAVLMEWRGGTRGPKALLAAGVGALFSALAFATMPAGWPLFKALGVLWPLAMAALSPVVFESGWLTRLDTACASPATPVMQSVPRSAEWLTLAENERGQVLAALRREATVPTPGRLLSGQDRRSAAEFMGWPLWHIATGVDPVTGEQRTARGWYARGRKARGLFAVGQFAQGWVAVGQMAVGIVALGQMAVGLLAGLGQLAIGSLFAVGQLALAMVAAGQLAWGLYITSLVPFSADLGWQAVVLGSLLVTGLVGCAGVVLRGLLGREEQAAIERQFAGLADDGAVADEASLSLAERMTGGDPERGLSSVDVSDAPQQDS